MTRSRPPSRAYSPPRRWRRSTAVWCCSGAASVTWAGGTFAFPLPAFPSQRSAEHAIRTLREHRGSYFRRAPDFNDAPKGDDMTTSTATTTVPYAEQLRPAGPCWAKPCCAPPCRGRCTAGCSAKGSAPPPQRPRLTTCSTRSALRPAAGQRQDLRLAHACDRRLPPPGRQHHGRPRARPDHRTPHVLPGNRRPVPQPGTGPPRHRPDPRSSAPEVPGGHGPWLEDPAGCTKLVTSHLTATGFAPAA